MNLVILTNILTPYRKFLYDLFDRQLREQGGQFTVLVMQDGEPNRHWRYEEYAAPYTRLLQKRVYRRSDWVSGFTCPDLKDVLRELQPDVVVAAGGYNMLPVMQACRYRRALGYRLFFWSEGNLHKRETISLMKRQVRDFGRRTMFRRFEGFWYVGAFSKDFIVHYAREDVPLCFLPNLVDPAVYAGNPSADRAAWRQRLAIPEEQTIFLSPSRLSPEKGMMEFLELLSRSERRQAVTWLVVGDGELTDAFQKRLEEIGDIDVRVLGYHPADEVAVYYHVADCLVTPSLMDANPLACIEGLWAGLPLLVSRHVGNYPETVREGVNGYVFDYAQPDEAVGMIDALITSSREWREQARHVSQTIARTVYEPETAVARCLAETAQALQSLDGQGNRKHME